MENRLLTVLLTTFLLLESIRCRCSASELKDESIEIKRNGRILTDYSAMIERGERFQVRCKSDRFGRHVWTGHCNARQQFEFVRKTKKLEGTIIDYCQNLYKSCYVGNVPYEIKFDLPNNTSTADSNILMDFYCRNDPSEERVGQIMCWHFAGLKTWTYRMGGRISFEHEVESHCERFVTGCKKEYKPQYDYREDMLDEFDYQKHLSYTKVRCRDYRGGFRQTAVCVNREWQIWNNGVKINVSDAEFCEKKKACSSAGLPYFTTERKNEDVDHNNSTNLSIHCAHTTKTVPLNALCNRGYWTFMKNNSKIDYTSLEYYCVHNAEDKCHFNPCHHSRFLQDPLNSLSRVSLYETIRFSCLRDYTQKKEVEAKCVQVFVGRFPVFDWAYSIGGIAMSERDVILHCSRSFYRNVMLEGYPQKSNNTRSLNFTRSTKNKIKFTT